MITSRDIFHFCSKTKEILQNFQIKTTASLFVIFMEIDPVFNLP